MDAPLQQAISTLKSLGSALQEQGKEEEAAQVVTIIQLIKKQHFMGRSSQKQMFEELLKDATEEEAAGMRQWVADDDEPIESKADPTASQNSELSSRVMKWTRKVPKLLLSEGDASSLGQLLEHSVLEWEFDINKVQSLSNGHALMALGWAVIERHGLRAKLNLRTEAVMEFLHAVEQGYKNVPYHSSVHGADVTHALHWILCTDSLTPLVANRPLLLFTALISALVHDVGHDGFNNAFHINSNSLLAIKACYSSPLERHHLATAFTILAEPQSVLVGLDLAERKQVQTWMRELVLATDFGVHHAVISEFKTMLDMRGVIGDVDGSPIPTTRQLMDTSMDAPSASFEADEITLALKMVIKTADLGYLTKGEQSCHVWTERVLQEFFHQGDTEKSLNLPISFGCDRSIDVPGLQLGFYKTMIFPLYEALDLLVPMDLQLKNLNERFKFWQKKKDETAAA